MNLAIRLLLFGAVATVHVVAAPRATRPPAVSPPDTLLTIKQKADAGDPKAQIALGDKLAENRYQADALVWYRKASATGCIDADYRVGAMLMNGAKSPVAGQAVYPNAAEGIHAMFRAATNSHVLACREMSQALLKGLGVETNRIAAYAWLQYVADRELVRRPAALDSLALKMTTSEVEAGQTMAKLFANRQWPKLSVRAAPKVSVPLKLDGVSAGGKTPLAVINRRTLAAGETISIPVYGRAVQVKCLEIGEDCALIEVEGESQPQWLRFDAELANR